MEILSRQQAAALADIHERTLDRLHIQGVGPPRIQITRRRCGYERATFERWLKSRAFSSQAAGIAAGVIRAVPPETVARAKEARARGLEAKRRAKRPAKKRGKRT
jgi:hypothetical protein